MILKMPYKIIIFILTLLLKQKMEAMVFMKGRVLRIGNVEIFQGLMRGASKHFLSKY